MCAAATAGGRERETEEDIWVCTLFSSFQSLQITHRMGRGHGRMPSTHSAVITYFATYITLACAYLPIHPTLPVSPALSRVLPVLISVPLATTIAVSRTWLGHHTWPQVTVGCAYGLLFAPIWFRLWTGGINEYGPVVEDMVRSYIS